MTLTTADLVVLAVLLRAGAMHGYEVWQRLDRSDVQDWARVSRPQVYYSLRKLADTGHLERTDTGEPSRGPERATFRATPAAERAMRDALRAGHWTERDPPSPFVTWCALALNGEAETVQAQLSRRRHKLCEEISHEEATLRTLSGVGGRDAAIGRALIRMAIEQMKAETLALGEIEKALLGDDAGLEP